MVAVIAQEHAALLLHYEREPRLKFQVGRTWLYFGEPKRSPNLFRHYFVRQLTPNYFANIVAFLSRFDHGLSGSVMPGEDGGCFSVALLQCRPVRKHQPHRNIPVIRAVGGHVGPDLVVGNDAFLLYRIVGRLQVLAEIFPEWFSLTRL